MRSILLALVAAAAMTVQPALANGLTGVELAPITHAEAQLVVVSPDGTETAYTPADLENFPTYRLVTTTPWREVPAEFEGVLLSDILEANALSAAASIIVIAENDYSTTISRELASTVPILVATRVNGKAHTRRERGPIQFVIDAEVLGASNLASESTLVWMAARIEAGS